MDKAEMIRIASYAIMKHLDFESLKYCDELYGKEAYAEDVYEYVVECRLIGEIAFREKYKEFKLY